MVGHEERGVDMRTEGWAWEQRGGHENRGVGMMT